MKKTIQDSMRRALELKVFFEARDLYSTPGLLSPDRVKAYITNLEEEILLLRQKELGTLDELV